MKTTALLLTLTLLVWAGWAQTPASKKPPAKKGAVPTARKAPATKQGAPKQAPTKGRYTASTKAKAGTPKTGAPKTKSGPVAAGKGKAGSTKASASKSRYSRNSTYATRARTYVPAQQQPTPDRYREIQSALIERGYLNGEPSGQWDPQSAEALKRFQTEQNLEANGKLDSLSLIALGLGPKRTASAQARPQ